MEPVTQLIVAVASLVGALAWPTLLLFVVVKFRNPLNDFFTNLSEFSVKAPGLEASARRQQIQAAVAMVRLSQRTLPMAPRWMTPPQ